MNKRYEKYLDYSTSDFAMDEDFIDWIKSPNPIRNEFWNTLLVSHPFLEKRFNDARLLLNSIDNNIPVNSLETKNAIWEVVI